MRLLPALGLVLLCGCESLDVPTGTAAASRSGPRNTRTFACGFDDTATSDARCQTDGDCVTESIQIDCCGTQRVTGVRATARGDFIAAARACLAAPGPLCSCPSGVTTADDGSIAEGWVSADVKCVQGLCTSTFAVQGQRTLPCAPDRSWLTANAACSIDAECTVGFVELDCCGSLHATGIRTDGPEDFPASAGLCAEALGDCGCAPLDVLADDGSTGAGPEDPPAVACVSNLCTTFF